LVILGAGYDTRAYRFDKLKEEVKVFEVDHPATQKVKIEKVSKALGSLPGHVVYVSVDFEKERLDKKLSESGYNKSLKTLFIWEGVTMYLTAEAVDETLAFVAGNSGKGSSIIFNYIFRSVLDGTCELEYAPKVARLIPLLVLMVLIWFWIARSVSSR
jgi:methyltransferase (TIGR00027 family)